MYVLDTGIVQHEGIKYENVFFKSVLKFLFNESPKTLVGKSDLVSFGKY